MAAFAFSSIQKQQNQSGSLGSFSILVVARCSYYTIFPPQKQLQFVTKTRAKNPTVAVLSLPVPERVKCPKG
jgi:hypothetical protein